MDRRHRIFRKLILKKVSSLQPHDAQILQTSASAFAIDLAQPSEKSLDADKIVLRMLRRVLDEERPSPAPSSTSTGCSFGNIPRNESRSRMEIGKIKVSATWFHHGFTKRSWMFLMAALV